VPEEDPDKAENKGAFAVSGKNSTYNVLDKENR
jgi:hypothetical protein